MRVRFNLLVLILFALAFSWNVRSIWIPRFSLSPQHAVDPKNLVNQLDVEAGQAVFNNRRLQIPKSTYSLTEKEIQSSVLGRSDVYKKIFVDLANQRLYAFEGSQKVYDFLISSGKWGWTPTGTFKIWIKLRSTKMEGGKKELGTYYYLPNVPFVMYFYNDEIPKWRGYGLHGTYWHNNFGMPMSHGCVNLKTEDAEKLFYWTNPDLRGKSSVYASQDNPGTEIVIYGKASLQ